MIPTPVALGLFLCDRVIVDQATRCPTPVNIFTGRAVDQFPSDPQQFSIFAALSDGAGQGTMELSVVHLDSGSQVFARGYPIRFPNRHTVVNVNVRIRQLRFPAIGTYEFLLWIDGTLVSQRTLRVYQIEE